MKLESANLDLVYLMHANLDIQNLKWKIDLSTCMQQSNQKYRVSFEKERRKKLVALEPLGNGVFRCIKEGLSL